VFLTSLSFFRNNKLPAKLEPAAVAALADAPANAAAAAAGGTREQQQAQQLQEYAVGMYKWVQKQLQPGWMTLTGCLLVCATASLARITLFTDDEALAKLQADLADDQGDDLGPIARTVLLWIFQAGPITDPVNRFLLDGACVLSAAAAMRICAVAVAAFPVTQVRGLLQGSRGLLLGSVLPVFAVLFAFAMPLCVFAICCSWFLQCCCCSCR
jgi:hypothetical protein